MVELRDSSIRKVTNKENPPVGTSVFLGRRLAIDREGKRVAVTTYAPQYLSHSQDNLVMGVDPETYQRIAKHVKHTMDSANRAVDIDADDLGQITMGKALQVEKSDKYNPNNCKGPNGRTNYIFTIAHNEMVTALRKANVRRRQVSFEDRLEGVVDTRSWANTEYTALQEVQKSEIVEALSHLTPKQAQVIRLRYFEDMTDRQISQFLNVPLGSIKTRIRLSLTSLREILVS